MRKLRNLWSSHKKYCTTTIAPFRSYSPISGYPNSSYDVDRTSLSYNSYTNRQELGTLQRQVDNLGRSMQPTFSPTSTQALSSHAPTADRIQYSAAPTGSNFTRNEPSRNSSSRDSRRTSNELNRTELLVQDNMKTSDNVQDTEAQNKLQNNFSEERSREGTEDKEQSKQFENEVPPSAISQVRKNDITEKTSEHITDLPEDVTDVDQTVNREENYVQDYQTYEQGYQNQPAGYQEGYEQQYGDQQYENYEQYPQYDANVEYNNQYENYATDENYTDQNYTQEYNPDQYQENISEAQPDKEIIQNISPDKNIDSQS
ncbi:unnamed protein product [Leptosia nina]|uniref:Uncharacterized protein n=1 Tax=Leptosia nina TaxID=320188 RepID=A0AAV1JIN5_9NEOP